LWLIAPDAAGVPPVARSLRGGSSSLAARQRVAWPVAGRMMKAGYEASIQMAFTGATVLPFHCTSPWRAETSHGGTMSLQARIESLKERHATLDARIADEDHRPAPDNDAMFRMKVEKLRVKEEMERLRSA
jgi:hypothetical protein